LWNARYGLLDREERVRNKPQRTEKLEEEKNEQLKAAVKPKEVQVVESGRLVLGIIIVEKYGFLSYNML